MNESSSTNKEIGETDVRTATRALIVEGEKVLLVKYRKGSQEWYTPPGGGQRFGENLHDALRRECREELGTELEIGPLVAVRDYIADNHGIEQEEGTHQLELMFHCSLPEDFRLGEGGRPDEDQVAIEWVSFDSLREIHVFPEKLKEVIPDLPARPNLVYLGDVN